MQALLEHQEYFPNLETIIGVDRDSDMLSKARTHLQPYEKDVHIETVQGSYAQIGTFLKGRKSDFILLDLGVNMEHFKDGSRGFSLKAEGELDMRFDRTGGKPLKAYLETRKTKELEQIFIVHADMREGNAQKLARQMTEYRNRNPIRNTTHELVQFLKTQ
jgi:16S rRNA C1402 N4-methylase RsmH